MLKAFFRSSVVNSPLVQSLNPLISRIEPARAANLLPRILLGLEHFSTYTREDRKYPFKPPLKRARVGMQPSPCHGTSEPRACDSTTSWGGGIAFRASSAQTPCSLGSTS